MDDYGYIKLSRKITEMDGYFGERFSRCQCWVDLLLLAEWRPQRLFYIRGIKVVIERGQVAISFKELSQRWLMSINTVRKRIAEMIDDERIECICTQPINVFKIVKYNDYQDCTKSDMQKNTENKAHTGIFSGASDTQNDTQSDIQSDTQNDTPYKNNKEYKENNIKEESIKKKSVSRFLPPSIEEVEIYIQEKGYDVDAEQFVNFYESKGWFVGSNKMKNWHAAVATWQKRNSERKQKTNKNKNDNAGNSENKRGGAEIIATSAQDYQGDF